MKSNNANSESMNGSRRDFDKGSGEVKMKECSGDLSMSHHPLLAPEDTPQSLSSISSQSPVHTRDKSESNSEAESKESMSESNNIYLESRNWSRRDFDKGSDEAKKKGKCGEQSGLASGSRSTLVSELKSHLE